MAIYHCSIGNVSRGKGGASTATAAYITGRTVYDDRLGQTFCYGRAERIAGVGMVLPGNAPKEWGTPEKLFNAIELYEKASDARTAKKIEVALPRELTLEQQKSILRNYIQAEITPRGYAAVWAIHNDPDNRNPHAHILVPNRKIADQGWVQTKTKKEYKLDSSGNRIPVIDPATGMQKVDKRNRKQWQRVSVQTQPLDRKETLQTLREAWARECNRYLAPDHQIDHRSLLDQGADRMPTVHEGYAARQIEGRGETSERCQCNRDIRRRKAIAQRLAEIAAEIARLLQLGRGAKAPERAERITDVAGAIREAQEALRADRRADHRPEHQKRDTGDLEAFLGM